MNVLDKRFKYTPVSEMGPDYLKKRFQEIREEQKQQERAKCVSNLNEAIARRKERK